MRIGLDITKALSPRDGVGNYTAQLLSALGEIESDIELRLHSLTAPDLPPPHEDNLDLFHATGWAVPPGLTCPLVYTCYDLTFLSHPAFHTLDNKVHCLTGVLQARLADAHFVAISQATARDLEERLGLPTSRIHTIYPAVASAFRPLPEDDARRHLRQRFGSEAEGGFVLAVGTLEPRKNLRRLVEAHDGLDEELKRRYPLLVAGGRGWKLESDELLGGEHVHGLGFVDLEDLVALYSAATVFAYPSLAEGFGLPVLEAMACGAPVITSDTSSLPEVTGEAARLVDPSDVTALRKALRDLIEKPAERKRLGESGLERARAFSWRQTARQTLDLYREILSPT